MAYYRRRGNYGGFAPPVPTVKVYCRANPNYAMTVRNGKVVLAPANPKDQYQASLINNVSRTHSDVYQGFILRVPR
jgi:hypothetical protein